MYDRMKSEHFDTPLAFFWVMMGLHFDGARGSAFRVSAAHEVYGPDDCNNNILRQQTSLDPAPDSSLTHMMQARSAPGYRIASTPQAIDDTSQSDLRKKPIHASFPNYYRTSKGWINLLHALKR